MARAQDWTEAEFEILLNNWQLSDVELVNMLPMRTLGAIGVVRAGIHNYHLGGNISMLSQMMVRNLEDRRGSLTCSRCRTQL